MRRQPKCYAHLARCHPQPRIGPNSTCDDTANATEAARGSTLLPTTAASGRASGLYPHLQLGACPMRCHTTCNAHLARRRPLPHVGPLQHIQRLSHGRARIDAAAHHGRLRGRSRRLSISTDCGASDAPPHAVPQPQVPPPTASARRAAAAHAKASAAAARGTPLPPTTAASADHLGLHPHLRHTARLMRRTASSGDHLASR